MANLWSVSYGNIDFNDNFFYGNRNILKNDS